MPVEITHIAYGDHIAAEYNAAEELKKKFEDFFQENVSGKIQIFSGVTLTGGEARKDVDIFIAGYLDNYHQDICCKSFSFEDKQHYDEAIHDVYIQSFFFPIELKDHPAKRIRIEGFDIQVDYNKSWHSVTIQSNQQQTSLQNLFTKELGGTPFIRNLIWFRQLTEKDALKIFGYKRYNVIFGDFDVKEMFSSAVRYFDGIRQVMLTTTGKYIVNDIKSSLNNSITPTSVESVMNLFKGIREGCGELTRQKLELLTQKLVTNDLSSTNNGLTICKGRAGTGKTVRILQYAKIKAGEGYRCLLLTYNHALVSDIKRLLAICGIPDGIDEGTIQVMTLHSFFFNLGESYSLSDKKWTPGDFDSNYNERISQLKQITTNCEEQHRLGWDYIFIDEAQDWNDEEKDILFNVYGANNIIVADGIDQFMRSTIKQDWSKGVSSFSINKYTIGLRQKNNLSSFVNTFAFMAGVNWDVKINDKLRGGNIIITDSYSSKLHNELVSQLKEDGNSMYDMLMLVPSSLTTKDETGTHYKNIHKMAEKGIQIFDGTNENNRHRYPTNLNECRLFQYESCRGLEGWCVVCMHLDEAIQAKINYAPNFTSNDTMIDPNVAKQTYAYLWSLMPLTRAIDTLVIVLKDSNSKLGKILMDTAKAMRIVDWRISKPE